MQVHPWRGFNRLFFLLTIVWAIYCAILYPLQIVWEYQQEAISKYDKDVKTCQKIYVKNLDYGSMTDCLKLAQESETEALALWPFREFWGFDVAFWKLEIPAIVLPPLLVYALAMMGRWVWRGFRPPMFVEPLGDEKAGLK